MSVQRCSGIQDSHATMHNMVQVEVTHFKGRSVRRIACGAICALQVRISAVVFGTFWAVSEAIYSVPRLMQIAMTVIKHRQKEEPADQAFWKIMKLWSNMCKTQALQGLGFVAAATVPELLYALDGEKTFYHHHIEAFVNSLADFPHVDNVQFGNFGPDVLEPMAKLWLDLGLTNTDYKGLIKQTLRKTDKKDAFDRFNETSLGFVKLLFHTLNEKIIASIKEEVIRDTLTPKKLRALKPLHLIMMYSKLSPKEREKIFEVCPDFEEKLEMHTDEVNFYYAAIYHRKFRPPQVVAFSNILLAKMQSVKDDFVKHEVFSVDDIEGQFDPAYQAILCTAIYYMVLQAEMPERNPGVILFSTRRDGKKSVLKNDTQMYGARPALVQLYQELKKLTPPQHRALLEHLQFTKDVTIHDPQVQACFNGIGSLRINLVEHHIMKNEGLCDEDQTPWHKAFICTPL